MSHPAITKTGFCLLLYLLPLWVLAQQPVTCADCTAYNTALGEIKDLAQREGEPYPEAATAAYATVLRYHRRRTDPDSILLAANNLLRAAAEGSRAYAFAAFSVAEAHLNLFDEPAYLAARTLLETTDYAADLRPLVDFYLLVLDVRYDQKIALNAERMGIVLLNVMEKAEDHHPEMLPDLLVTICGVYDYLGLVPILTERCGNTRPG